MRRMFFCRRDYSEAHGEKINESEDEHNKLMVVGFWRQLAVVNISLVLLKRSCLKTQKALGWSISGFMI